MCDECNKTTDTQSQLPEGTTGNPKYIGDCHMCGWPCYEYLTHVCTTVPRVSWERVTYTSWTAKL